MNATHIDSRIEACRVTVVIVNYFSSEQTTKLIDSIIHSIHPNINISIICADNSADKTEYEKLTSYQKQQPALKLIFNTENLGFGAAINRAIGSSEADYYLLVNPDVSLNENTFVTLMEHAQRKPSQGVWGGLTVLNNGQPDFRHAWREPTLLRALSWAIFMSRFISINATIDNYKNTILSTNTSYPVDSISGCCMLISNKAWKTVSGFDERFFLYSEELDFCKRARQAGFQPTVIPRASLQHAISHTADNQWRLETLYNSKFLYAEKHHHPSYVFTYRLITAFGSLIRSIVFFISCRKSLSLSWFTIFHCSLKKNSISNQVN